MEGQNKKSRVTLPLGPEPDREFLHKALDTALEIIEESGLGGMVTRVNVYQDINPGMADVFPEVRTNIYQVYFQVGSEEYWVKAALSSNGRYEWADSLVKDLAGGGCLVEDCNLTQAFEHLKKVVLEAIRRFTREESLRKGMEAEAEEVHVGSIREISYQMESIANGIPRTDISI